MSLINLERWTAPVVPPVNGHSAGGPAPAGPRRERGRNTVLAAPLILVTALALLGQYGWFHDAMSGHTALVPAAASALLASLTLETIGLFFAAEAHARLMAGDAAGPVRALSYLAGVCVGALSWWHWRPGSVALVFGVMSALSPWLWAIRSRSMRRAELRAAGVVDVPPVKLGWRRWVISPRRSWRIYRRAVWAGITDPGEALALEAARTPPDATETAEGLAVPAPPVEAASVAPAASPGPPGQGALPVDGLLSFEGSVKKVLDRLRAGEDLSVSKLAAEGVWGSRSRGGDILRTARASL